MDWLLCLKRRDALVRLRRSAWFLGLDDVVAPPLIVSDAWMAGKLAPLRVSFQDRRPTNR